MSRKKQTLAIKAKSEVIILDYSEVAADLVDMLRKNEKVFDPSMFQLLEPEVGLIATILSECYEPTVVWNLLATDFSKGVLLGLVAEEISLYYAKLEEEAEAGEDDEFLS